VAQLMALMDGLESRGQVMVVAATNIADALDPALRRPGRFDREVHIGVPNQAGRLKILEIHTREMPLAADVGLDEIADFTYGYVGADLANLCREAAMIRLRKEMSQLVIVGQQLSEQLGERLTVHREDFIEALKNLTPAAMRDVSTETRQVRWSDIGGLEEAKKILQEAIEWPLKYAALFRYAHTPPTTGLLLHGPPGTGKSLLARAVACESGANFIVVKGPQLLSKWVGDSEKGVRELFKKAHLLAPCVLFFDELDALAPPRGAGSDSQVTERVVSQMLTEIDALAGVEGVTVLAATNRLDRVDPALLSPGRLDTVVQLTIPDRQTRHAVFDVHTRGRPLAPDVNLETLADLSEGYSGGSISLICRRATMLAIRDYIEKGGDLGDYSGFAVDVRHFRSAMDEMRRSVGLQRLQGAGAEASAAPTEPISVNGVSSSGAEKDGVRTKTRAKARPASATRQTAQAAT
jgi:transitional endoplasmic reticulum ATPase